MPALCPGTADRSTPCRYRPLKPSPEGADITSGMLGGTATCSDAGQGDCDQSHAVWLRWRRDTPAERVSRRSLSQATRSVIKEKDFRPSGRRITARSGSRTMQLEFFMQHDMAADTRRQASRTCLHIAEVTSNEIVHCRLRDWRGRRCLACATVSGRRGLREAQRALPYLCRCLSGPIITPRLPRRLQRRSAFLNIDDVTNFHMPPPASRRILRPL